MLLPGLLFGGLFLLFTPLHVVYGLGIAGWPISNALFAVAALLAHLRPSRGFAGIPLLAWCLATMACSVGVIVDTQGQINAHDHPCGNLLIGPILLQYSAVGTLCGMLVLARDVRQQRGTPPVERQQTMKAPRKTGHE